MEHSISVSGASLMVNISGKFTFADNAEFRAILQKFSDGAIRSATLNLNAVEFVDSAALGMFLLANEAAAKAGVSLSLTMPRQDQPRKMFQVSRFEDIFTIVES